MMQTVASVNHNGFRYSTVHRLMRVAAILLVLNLVVLSVVSSVAAAQPRTIEIHWPTGERNPVAAIMAADLDDDNDNAVPDALERSALSLVADDEIVAVTVTGSFHGPLRARVRGPV